MLIAFDAGSDIVTSGKLVMSCSNGILLIPPGKDPGTSEWKSDCEIEFNPCKPGDKQELRAHIRCGVIDNFSNDSISQVDCMDTAHGLSAKLFTTYLHSRSINYSKSELPAMKTVLESFVPVLEKAALSVESVETHWLDSDERFILSVTLTSNTPYHFSIEAWDIELPPPIKLQENVDLNQQLLQRFVHDGDQLSFAFECLVDRDACSNFDVSHKSVKMHLKLRDDSKKLFTLDLDLDMNDLWMKLTRLPKRKPIGYLEAALKLENDRGLVGEPISLRYSVDLKGFTQPPGTTFAYSVLGDGRDWLVGGKVKGVMQTTDDSSGLSCEIVGIPILSGVLRRFPRIALELIESNGVSAPVKVDNRYPDAFQSLSRVEAIGVAYSSSK
jgi:hypothetical protein